LTLGVKKLADVHISSGPSDTFHFREVTRLTVACSHYILERIRRVKGEGGRKNHAQRFKYYVLYYDKAVITWDIMKYLEGKVWKNEVKEDSESEEDFEDVEEGIDSTV
jgi:hypothetical protein